MTASSSTNAGPPRQIYLIRHGEKPADPPTPTAAPSPPFGVDISGNPSIHSLLPRGWQRSGALTVLFAPSTGALQEGLQSPATLLSPNYGKPDKTHNHRTYQTIQGLSDRLDIAISSPFTEGEEGALASAVVSGYAGVVLICWEHQHIPAIVTALPTVAGTQIPSVWPGDRFDVIWSLTLQSEASPAEYVFAQVPQQLLAGDTATII